MNIRKFCRLRRLCECEGRHLWGEVDLTFNSCRGAIAGKKSAI